MIKLVVFDLWDTLAYKDVEMHPLDVIRKNLNVGKTKDEFIKLFEESTQTKKWNSKKEAYKNFCRNIGIPESDKNINTIIEIRDNAEEKIKLFEYTTILIEQLKEQNYETGIASNSTCFIIEKLKEKTDFLDKIDYPLFSFDVGVVKPSPKIFYKMIEKSGYKANEIVMIGDNYYDDIIPAREIGMHAIHFGKSYEELKKELSFLGVFIN